MAKEYKEVGLRKARIAPNICDESKPFGVFKHTCYLNRWYYDGYIPCATQQEAEETRDKWLNREI